MLKRRKKPPAARLECKSDWALEYIFEVVEEQLQLSRDPHYRLTRRAINIECGELFCIWVDGDGVKLSAPARSKRLANIQAHLGAGIPTQRPIPDPALPGRECIRLRHGAVPSA